MGGRRDPEHDRVRLTAHERADFARLERSLAQEFPEAEAGGLGRRRRVAARRWGAQVWARFVRLAPWFALAAALATPLAITRSERAGTVCAVFVVVTLTVWLVTSWGRFRDRIAARRTTAPEREPG